MIRRILLTLAASVLTLVGTAPAALAQTYSACNGVWVVVDFGSLGGGVSTKCATSFSTGTAALRGAGFTPTLDNGFLEKINGKPSSPNRQTAYWSYWQATRSADGTYGAWKYSNTGANSSHPVKGNAEGWHYVSVSGGATPPGAKPPKNPVVTASAPSSSPSATKSASTPTTAASSTKPSKATPSASSASKTSTTTKPSASSSSPSPDRSVSPSPSDPTTSSSASFPSPAPSADPPEPAEPVGSPLAVIATTSALAMGAAGAGGWWLWKGRRR